MEELNIKLMPFKDDVMAFAKLNPTDRIQHLVCEAKNEVRKVLKPKMKREKNGEKSSQV